MDIDFERPLLSVEVPVVDDKKRMFAREVVKEIIVVYFEYVTRNIFNILFSWLW